MPDRPDHFSVAQRCVAILAARFPKPAIPAATLRLYGEHLEDVDPWILHAAVESVIRRVKFFPALAEIFEDVYALQPDGRPEPELAWEEVLTQIRAVGCNWGVPSRGPEFSTPLIARALKSVASWEVLCAGHEHAADRRCFIDAYRVLLQRARFEERLPTEAKRLVAAYKAEQEARRIATSGAGS